MEAKELMIGDWIRIDEPDKYAGATGQIQTLMYHREGDAVYFHVFIQDRLGCVSRDVCSDDIRPIQLTPEILEKNGFIRGMFYGEWEFDLDQFPFYVVQRKNNSWYLGREEFGKSKYCEIIDISYVHELQHALRLCGIKKEIKL